MAYNFSTVRTIEHFSVWHGNLTPHVGTSLSYASVMGITKELKLVGQDYSWISSVFFFGLAQILLVTHHGDLIDS